MDEHHLFEQFDEPALNILRFAEVEARLFQQEAIGTEHLLLGVMHHPPTRAPTTAFYFPFLDSLGANLDDVRAIIQQVMQSLGIDLDQIRRWVSPLPPFPSTPAEVTRFGRLTERARQTVSLSQEEARRLQHHWAGGEHLVLGLLRQDAGVAVGVLTEAGVELNPVRQLLVSLLGRGQYAVPGEIALTPRARKVILRAVDEAELLGHAAGETGHLLLSLVREDEGIAAGIFEHLGVSREDIRTEEALRWLANEA